MKRGERSLRPARGRTAVRHPRRDERLFLAHQVRAEFLAWMSRELRLPLDHIIDFARLLREEGAVTKGQERCLEEIIQSSLRLRSTVGRILDLSELHAGIGSFVPTRFDYTHVLRRIVTGLEEPARHVGITLRTIGIPPVGELTADEEKFSFVVDELLRNALRHSAPGSTVTLGAAEATGEHEGRRFIEVTVEDEGRGIAPDDCERIFDAFETGCMEEGLGLGLAIARRFVEMHGGRIWVYSKPGRGSSFTFALPAEGLSSHAEPSAVLLAGASRPVSPLFAGLLQREGYLVLELDSAMETLARGVSHPPDLFVLSHLPPHIDAVELTKGLRSRRETRLVPVIVISPRPDPRLRLLSMQAGADIFLPLPVELEELLLWARRLISRKLAYDRLRRERELAEAQAATDPATGLYNQRHLWEVLERELRRTTRYGRECSVAMIDIDFFKHYNDAHGHLQGDEVLRQAAMLFREQIRSSDIAARYGGEEFVIVMPETGKRLALLVGEKLRRAFEEFPFQRKETQPGGALTISMGIATFPGDADNPHELVDWADKLLYRAKKGGRNRVEGEG